MQSTHPLRVFLQFQLATDDSTVLHISHVVSSLSQEALTPSPHLSKWTMRLNSLLHSKDAGVRWAGLCLAHRTSELSRDVMIQCAESWLSITLPLLSKNEPIPTLKASVRLLQLVFSSGVGLPEYQRQIATPSVPKFISALIMLAEKFEDQTLRVLVLTTLAHLVTLYPTVSRVSRVALSTLSLRFLGGSSPYPSNESLLRAASLLYSHLHLTGGKVGASNLWRKSVDETLESGWSALSSLRTSFQNSSGYAASKPISVDEALVVMPLSLDKLQCCTVVLCDLLSSAQRLVQLPIGSFIQFINALLTCNASDKTKDHVDPAVQAMEMAAIPQICQFGCDIALHLSQCARHHLTPHLTHLISSLSFRLEQEPMSSQRLFILQTIESLLAYSNPLDSPLALARLAKAILPILSSIFATNPESKSNRIAQTNKKRKKHERNFQGDEVLKLSKETILPDPCDGKVLIIALRVMRWLLRNPILSPALQSISARILLSMSLVLPQMPPYLLSPDLGLHAELVTLIQSINVEFSTTNVMSKHLGLVACVAMRDSDHDTSQSLETLLHPRVPPFLRPLPSVQSLALSRVEESREEADIREELGLNSMAASSTNDEDVDMRIDVSTDPRLESTSFQEPHTQSSQPASEQPQSVSLRMSPWESSADVPPVKSSAAETPPPFATPAHLSISNPLALDSIDENFEEQDEQEEIPLINMESDSSADE